MEQLSNQKKLRPWMGFIVQAGFLALFLTAGAWMQRTYGIPGLIASELMFLVVAVLYCLIRGVKLREMFPVKKITVSDFFGVVILAAAAFLFAMVGVGISLSILPKSYRAEVVGLSDFLFGKMNFIEMVLVVALLPAVCEEAMERGCVLSHFRSIKKDWVIVLIMGVFFGIMHWSPLRFLSTAVGGAVMTYLVVKKNNILLSMLLHFINNFSSVALSYLASLFSRTSTAEASSQLMEINGLSMLGAYMFLAFAAPVLLVTGMMLIDREHHKAYRFAIAGGVSAIMFFGGFGIMTVSVMNGAFASVTTSAESKEKKPEVSIMAYEYEVGKDIPREEFSDFYFTRASSTNPPEFQRYRIFVEDGKGFLYHETREGDHWPLEEADITVSGTVELTPAEYDEVWAFIAGGKVMRRSESADAGDDGPFLYFYSTGDKSEFQEFYFESYGKQQDFEAWCAAHVPEV
ncbi:MAG: CPBP family intramembrane metalloprotease [Clostridiales bacterium]|nr:CPBP family intramembrane metalloprotease [Clostridiales bacterium]